MAKELHVYTDGADPFTFVVGDVTVHVHTGSLSPVAMDPVVLTPPTPTVRPRDVVVRTLDPVVLTPPEPEALQPLDDVMARTGRNRFAYGVDEDMMPSAIKSMLDDLKATEAHDVAIHVTLEGRRDG